MEARRVEDGEDVMETTKVEGNDLVKNCVYNIYQKDKEDNYYNIGVYLVISDDNINNQDINLKRLNRKRYNLTIQKSRIYGKRPVNLTGADLTGLDLAGAVLTGAVLTGANLTGANLTSANLTGANLTSANLTDSNLTCAVLTGATLISAKLNMSELFHAILSNTNLNMSELFRANLTGANLRGANLTHAILAVANLTGADLTDADLRDANLRNANLTGTNLRGANLTLAMLAVANLTCADLTGATIFQDQLSDLQKRQIIGQPNYIQRIRQIPRQAQGYLNISKKLSNGNRISVSTGKKLDNSNFTTQHRISFTRLLDFLLQEENQEKIARSFKIVGERGTGDGITRIVFQKCYEAFMERYFVPYQTEDNSDYVVLKYLSPELFEEFEKTCKFMILFATTVKDQLKQRFQILIPIHPLLFQLLMSNVKEVNPETFFKLENKNIFFGKKKMGVIRF
jgi:uncharacterized protein YjbI with pentapeptide repeats